MMARLKEKYVSETFVIGSSNRFEHAMLMVAEAPSTS